MDLVEGPVQRGKQLGVEPVEEHPLDQGRVASCSVVSSWSACLAWGPPVSSGSRTPRRCRLRGRVLAAVRPGDFDVVAKAGASPVGYGAGLAANVRAVVPSVDAVIDASGAGVLGAAVELAGGADRVVTLSDPRAADFGVRLSGPDGPRIAERLQAVMALLAAGQLMLRAQTVAPLATAARVHRELEDGGLRSKVLLSVRP